MNRLGVDGRSQEKSPSSSLTADPEKTAQKKDSNSQSDLIFLPAQTAVPVPQTFWLPASFSLLVPQETDPAGISQPVEANFDDGSIMEAANPACGLETAVPTERMGAAPDHSGAVPSISEPSAEIEVPGAGTERFTLPETPNSPFQPVIPQPVPQKPIPEALPTVAASAPALIEAKAGASSTEAAHTVSAAPKGQPKAELAFQSDVVELTVAAPAGNPGGARPKTGQAALPSNPRQPQSGIPQELSEKQEASRQTAGVERAGQKLPEIQPARPELDTGSAGVAPSSAHPGQAHTVPAPTPATENFAMPAATPQTPLEPSRLAAAAAGPEPVSIEKSSSEPLQSMEFKITERNSPGVSLQVNDRGGRIEVTVRSADAALNQQLQSQLSILTDRLQTRGLAMENIRTIESAHAGDLTQQFQRDSRGQDAPSHSPWHRGQHSSQQGSDHQGRDRGLFRWSDEVDEQPAFRRKGR